MNKLAIHKFNDDLLLRTSERSLAKDAFPAVFHVLDHPFLRRLFEKFDAPAVKAKRRSRTARVTSIFFATLSLWAAAAEPLYRNSALADWIARHALNYDFRRQFRETWSSKLEG